MKVVCVFRDMVMSVSQRSVDRILAAIVLLVVLVSWGFVIYAARVAAQWELEKRTSTQR